MQRRWRGRFGTPGERAAAAFQRACGRLGPGDIAIDCGANIGVFTLLMAARGARVYAFEPNPTILQLLRERTAAFPNVTIIPKGVASDAGTARLYMHREAGSDPVAYSQAASLVASKPNVNRDCFEEIETIDLADFLFSLDRRVALAKIDIEGAEIDLLEHLLQTGAIQCISTVFVEMHDTRIPDLRSAGARLRRELTRLTGVSVNIDWK